ncbi:MAG: DUF2911 domain-containing protein [Acidobacteriota bacterium]|nr:DUF2911 domain-containing protein [Acidobacteriota bacterium]
MRKQIGTTAAGLVAALTIVGFVGLGSATRAQPLSVADVEEYLGTWTLAAVFQETPVELVLEIVGEDGEVRAALATALSPEPQLIDTITKTDQGLVLAYDANFSGNVLRIEVSVVLEDGALVGSFGDENGLFSADFTGERAAELAGIVAEAALAAAAASDVPSGPRRRFGSSQAKLDLGSGKQLRIKHGDMAIGSKDHESLLATRAGEIFSYTSSRTMKLLTDADLVFGDARVPAFNLAPNYPGCYGVWMKRVEDGWHLVFNNQADMWGSQYDPETDAAEVHLEVAELETPQEEFLVELTKEEGGGRLRIVWGNRAWSAPFQVE